MSQIIVFLIALAIIGPFIGLVIYYYYILTRKRSVVNRRDMFLLLIGGFAAGMLFLSLMRIITGAHTNGLIDPNRHSYNNNQYIVCYDINKQAE